MGERRILLVRHGHYDEREESEHDLTPIGRKQAQYLRSHLDRFEFDAIYASTMVRARTTAQIVAAGRPVRVSSLLAECLPTRVRGHSISNAELKQNRERLDRAFARFFRPSASRRTELFVCHGNVIRYIVCRAMKVPTSAWIRLAIHHCSVTEIQIFKNGRVFLVSYNETGHLPARFRTMSGAAKGLGKKNR